MLSIFSVQTVPPSTFSRVIPTWFSNRIEQHSGVSKAVLWDYAYSSDTMAQYHNDFLQAIWFSNRIGQLNGRSKQCCGIMVTVTVMWDNGIRSCLCLRCPRPDCLASFICPSRRPIEWGVPTSCLHNLYSHHCSKVTKLLQPTSGPSAPCSLQDICCRMHGHHKAPAVHLENVASVAF